MRGAEMVFNTDPDWPTEKILDEIKSKASWAEKNVGYVLQPFSALLVRLSRDAEVTAASVNEKTQELITLTRWLIGLTVVIIFLTAPLVFIEVSKYLSELPQSPLKQQEHSNSAGQQDQQTEATKKADDGRPASVAEPVNKPPVEAIAPQTSKAPAEKKE
jgi:hypothetical protein